MMFTTRQCAILLAVISLLLLHASPGRSGEAVGPLRPSATSKPKPGSAQDYYNQGVTKGLHGNYKEAAEFFRKAVAVDPRHVPAYNGWGIALAGLGRKDEAIGIFRKAAQISPKNAKVQYNWANTLSSMGRLEEAVVKYKRAAELQPDLAPAYSGWGTALAELGRYDESIEKLRKAASLDPKHAGKVNAVIENVKKLKAAKAKKKPAGAPRPGGPEKEKAAR